MWDDTTHDFCVGCHNAGLLVIVVVLLVIAAAIPYGAWTLWERRSHRRAAARHSAAELLGDEIVPVTLHPEIDLDKCIGSGSCVRACPEKDILAITDGRARLINPLVVRRSLRVPRGVPGRRDQARLRHRDPRRRAAEALRRRSRPASPASTSSASSPAWASSATRSSRAARPRSRSTRKAAAAVTTTRSSSAAGPAGTAAALGLEAHGVRALIVDQSAWGGTIVHYPRAKVVMTGSFELPGYGTVRKKTMSKEDLLQLWRDIRARTQLHIEEGVRVESIVDDGGVWRVVGTNGWSRRAANVVLALGRRGAPNQLGVPGEELPHVAYRILEPDVYARKRVLVVGGGNAAADCAIALAEQGHCESVALSYRRNELPRLRGMVRNTIDRLFRDGLVVPHLGTEVTEIRPDRVTLRGAAGELQLPIDAVIIQIGGRAPSELLRTVGIDLVEKRGAA